MLSDPSSMNDEVLICRNSTVSFMISVSEGEMKSRANLSARAHMTAAMTTEYSTITSVADFTPESMRSGFPAP